jgi:PncC family amidohydrolase
MAGGEMDVIRSSSKLSVTELVKVLAERGQTLAVAESCTGGQIAARLVEVPGVSAVFLGGVVSYDNSVKVRLLSVPSHLLKTMGAVSVVVTRAMAKGVRKAMKSDWAVAVSGIAGPTGGSSERPVGTVCFSLLGPGIEYSEICYFKGTRAEVQAASVEFALRMLAQHLG